MCGIIGYVGRGISLQLLIDGLKRLEYRGYDSAGVCYLNGEGLDVFKAKGRLHELCRVLPEPLPQIRIGLGHTRWATHGAPSRENAHPHTAHGVAVVHNGIIENYRDLKKELEAEGTVFASQTDTEVVPRLIARSLARGASVRESLEETIGRLKGSFALGVVCETSPDTLFAVRCGSPLVLGIGGRDYYLASDVPALLPYTRSVVFLRDGQLCTMTSDGIEIADTGSRTVIPATESMVTIDWTPSMAEKDGHGHFMHKEICEQPRSIADTVGEWLADPVRMLAFLSISPDGAHGLERFQIAACGTSYHAGLTARYLIERLALMPVNVDIASEYRYRRPVFERGTCFLSITQSGETADTLAAQREASLRALRTISVCNVVGSTAAREAGAVLQTRCGPEIGVASTKAFTAQIAALAVLAVALGLARRTLPDSRAGDILAALGSLPALMERACRLDHEINGIARTLLDRRFVLFLGRGLQYPIALEGALKLKEVSYIHAEGHAAGEMKHGPIALIEENVPVVVLIPRNSLFEKTLSNIEEVRARGGWIIAVTDDPAALEGKADVVLQVPATDPLLAPLLTVIPLQLLAYHIGVLRGCDVDKPRNLAKSVTVE